MQAIRRVASILIATMILSNIILSLPSFLEGSKSQSVPGDGNESFDTATEIPTDGSRRADSVNFDTDLVDFLKFDLQPAQGECLNTTVVVNASVPGTMIFAVFYMPDRLDFAWGVASGGVMELNYSFWAAIPGYYYVTLATMSVVDADYNISATTDPVVHTPDGDNSITEATPVSHGNAYNGRVNKTSDPYDLYKIQVQSDVDTGDGLYVHLDVFKDVGVSVFDPAGEVRDGSNLFSSSDPNRGETVRFVANQTGEYVIMVYFDSFMPEGEFANYELTVNITPGLPHDEDWSAPKAVPTTLGLHNGSFDSSFDEYDFLSIDLTKGDELNISFMTDTEDWDINVRVFDPQGEQMGGSGYGGGGYYRESTYIESNGSHHIEIHNTDWKIFNYTYLVTTDGVHFGNTRPLAHNITSDTMILAEDTNDTYDLSAVFDGGLPGNYTHLPGDTATGNISVNLSEWGMARIIPKADWYGNATLVFNSTGYFGNTLEFTLNVSVTPINDGPFFADIAGTPMPALFWIHATENSWKNFTANITDVDNSSDELTVTVTGDTDNLHYDPGDGLFHYLTSDGSLDSEEFTVSVSDGLETDTHTVHVDITSVNDAPRACPIILISGGNGSLTVTLSTDRGYDEEDDDLTYLWMFGDGYNEMDVDLLRVTHTYDAPGIYEVILEVNDSVLADRSTLEINVSLPEEPDIPQEPQWFDDLPDEPVGTNLSMQVEITSAVVTDRQLSEGSFSVTVNSTYDISGTCGPEVEVIYFYYGVEEPYAETGVWWRPIDEDAAKVEPDNGTWSLDFSEEDSYLLFTGLDWMKIMAMGWGDDGYNVDIEDADYEYIPYDDSDGEEIDPSLWKNMTKSYTDDEKDEMYRHMKITSLNLYTDEMEAEVISATFGERPDLDIIDLSSWLDGSTFHVDLTTRGSPWEPDPDISPLDLDDPKAAEEWLLREEVQYFVYLVSPDFNESGYAIEDLFYGQSTDEVDQVLEIFFLSYPISLFAASEIEGNTISWEVSLDTLAMWGLEPSTDFELFAFVHLQQTVEVYEEFASGYDSAGHGAFSPDTSSGMAGGNGGGGGEGSGSSLGTVALVLGGIGILVIIVVIIVIVLLVLRRKKKSPEKTPGGDAVSGMDADELEEEVHRLIAEAESKSIRVTGYRDDMESAISNYGMDPEVLGDNLRKLARRIQAELRPVGQSAGADAPQPPAPIPPLHQEVLGQSPERENAMAVPSAAEAGEPFPSSVPDENAPRDTASVEFTTPPCPSCGGFSTYYPEYECFYCDHCQEYVYEEGDSGMGGGNQAEDVSGAEDVGGGTDLQGIPQPPMDENPVEGLSGW